MTQTDERQAGAEVEVKKEMVDAALRALTPYLEHGDLGFADARPAMTAALAAALALDFSRTVPQ